MSDLFYITIDNITWESEKSLFSYKVLSWSWDAMIGPDEATVEVYGHEDILPHCWLWMGSGITISDTRWGPLWWGTIEEVEVHTGKIKITKTLNTVVNSLTVIYIDVASLQPGSVQVSDSDSQSKYGLRVQTQSLPTATVTQAQNFANTILQEFKEPKVRIDPGSGDLKAVLKLRGWIHRLGYRYYSNTSLTTMDASSAIQTILTSANVFPEANGVQIIDSAGVSVPIFTAANRTVKDRIMELLKTGTNDGKRLFLTISPSKYVSIYKQPSLTFPPQFLVSRDGIIWEKAEKDNFPIQRMRAGTWIGIVRCVYGTENLVAFIEKSTFNAESWQWSWQPYLQIDTPKTLIGITRA